MLLRLDKLELPEHLLVISYRDENGLVGLPTRVMRLFKQENVICVVLKPDECQPVTDLKPFVVGDFELSIGRVIVARGKDEQTMHQHCAGFLGPLSKVTIEGFPPGSFPVSHN